MTDAPLQPPSDETLLERHRSGDPNALRTLAERYQRDLLQFLYRMLGDRQAAEDVFQETFLQVHLSASAFDPKRRFRSWVFTIAANKARDLLRKKMRRHDVDLYAPVRGGGNDQERGAALIDLMELKLPDISEEPQRTEQEERVRTALSRMPPSLREILLLAYFQRLSYAQMAQDLQIPLGTVKSRLHSAVAAFAQAWKALTGEQGA